MLTVVLSTYQLKCPVPLKVIKTTIKTTLSTNFKGTLYRNDPKWPKAPWKKKKIIIIINYSIYKAHFTEKKETIKGAGQEEDNK